MSSAISIRGVGKLYRLGSSSTPYRTIRETLRDLARAPLRWLGGRTREPEWLWALKDVNFEVAHGEAVGLIGRNGAGKSTLLKILSRITPPTQGEVRLRGRVASLLEVGTGFHPELSGRENIFLNGAIMGMSRAEIRACFDEIVAFSEIERFIDTPVKRYSSGMYVRLAFAVAAHLRPDILVVDEVLAVGDASFQKKCLGKMQDAASGGRTVLFVSHNMPAVSRLCARAVLLSHGAVVDDGPVHKVVAKYLSGTSGESPTEVDFERRGRLPASDDVRLLATRIRSEGMVAGAADIRRAVFVEMDYEVLREKYPLHPNVHVFNDESTCVFVTSDAPDESSQRPRAPGRYRAVVEIPANFLAEGLYSLDVAISTYDPVLVHVWERGLLSVNIHDPGEGDSVRGHYAGGIPGVVRPMLRWRTEPLEPAKEARP